MVPASGPQGSYNALALFFSKDGGATWTTVRANSADSYARAIAVDPVREKVIYMGYLDYASNRCKLVKSIDGGSSWENIKAGDFDDIDDMKIDPLNTNNIYLCCGYGGFYKSENGGAGWKKLLTQPAHAMFISKSSHGEIIVGGNEVQVSKDRGKTWDSISYADISLRECMSLAYNEAQKILYLGLDGGGVIRKQL
jgi:photosystem II stability/assembly factor-like uncharacterized protein